MGEGRSRRQYDRQFKIDAVRLITEGGQSMASVSRELGVGRSQLQRWKKQFAQDSEHAFPGHGRKSGVEKELEDLRRELARVKEEREILKKALAVLSRRPG